MKWWKFRMQRVRWTSVAVKNRRCHLSASCDTMRVRNSKLYFLTPHGKRRVLFIYVSVPSKLLSDINLPNLSFIRQLVFQFHTYTKHIYKLLIIKYLQLPLAYFIFIIYKSFILNNILNIILPILYCEVFSQ